MFVVKVPKSRFYQIVYFVDGKRKTHSTKKTTAKEAWKYLDEFQNSLLNQRSKEISDQDEKKNFPTIAQFKNEYLDYVRLTKSKNYINSIDLSFKMFESCCGEISLRDIDTRIIDKFITTTFARTQRGAHQYYRTLKAAFNKALEWNYLETNAFNKVKFPKLNKTFPAFITEDELQLILLNTPYQHLRDIFTTAFYTGLRLGELINMEWNWIDFLQNQITIKCTKVFSTKSKKERIVPMSSKVKEFLSQRYKLVNPLSNDFVFCRIKGIKLHDETISKQFKTIARKLKLNEKVHFHSLRHSFASLLAQKGVSLYIIKELLGHEDLATTQIYSHLQQQNLKDAVNLL
ncbi:MAG: tyrosine-type recombinase/integrase [Melioribacteraceae bacterium]|nr:tyrosine-type recombinase/integrase [Melioribacteraceae bacterium]